MEKGQKALVYAENKQAMSTSSIFTSLFFPEEVTLSTAVTKTASATMVPVEDNGDSYNYSLSLSKTAFNIQINDDAVYANIRYQSSDGTTYLRTRCNVDDMNSGERLTDGTVKLAVPCKFTSIPASIAEFLTETNVNFEGLFYVDEVRDGATMVTYTGEDYKLPYDIINDSTIFNSWSSTSAKALFIFDTVTKDLEIYSHDEFMIKDNKLYTISTSGATAVRHFKYYYKTKEVLTETNVPVSQQGEIIHSSFSDLILACVGTQGIEFLDSNKQITGTYKNANIFPYKKKIFKHSNVGITTPADHVVAGDKVYTNAGVITGTFGSEVTTSYMNNLVGLFNNLINLPSAKSLNGLFQSSGGGGTNLDVRLAKYITVKGCEDIGYMFYVRRNVGVLDLEHWDVSSVKTMSMALANTDATEIKVSSWKLDNVEQMSGLFMYNSQLTEINIADWYAPKVKNISTMFFGIAKLQKIDARSFDFTTATSYSNLLGNTTPTTVLIIVKDQTQKNWFTKNFPTYTNVKTVAEYKG